MTTPFHRPLAVLCGPPGAGKTAIGSHLARQARVPFVDVDHEIERTTSRTIPDIFREDGEEGFRRLERATVQRLVRESEGVLALGGGSVLDEGTRESLRGQRVVYLRADLDTAVARLMRSPVERPLMRGGDPYEKYRLLMAQRGHLYESLAGMQIDTSTQRPYELAAEILALLPSLPTSITVHGTAPYEVHIGHHLLGQITSLAGTSRRVLILHAPSVGEHVQRLREALQQRGTQVTAHALPDAEAAKTMTVVADLWGLCGELHLGRDDTIIALGGGATTDLAGFVAATWLRGVRLLSVPTTLLAMVDAAVGGKTGINTEHGKNLVGSFYPPTGVVCDLATLTTLPTADLRAGLGEVIKCGFIADPRILELIERDPAAALDPTSEVTRETAERSIAVKARVVGEDLTEQGLREILNYGHTFAHAIERCANYGVRHGEAVAIGMVFAAELAVREIGTSTALVERTRHVLRGVDLPTTYAGSATWEELRAAMSHDKKRRADSLRFVLLSDVGEPIPVTDPSEENLRAAFAAVAAPGKEQQ